MTELYEFVKIKRYIRPNNGFIKQLELFEAMGFVIDKESLVYKCFMLDTMAENMKRGLNINEIFVNETPAANQQQSHYKCKKCRIYLFNITNRIKHLKSYEKYDLNDWNSKLNYLKKLNSGSNINGSNNSQSVCSKEIFIEPVGWLIDKISEIEGKVSIVVVHRINA